MACEKMSVDIPPEEEDLEKEHTRGPDSRCASEPGKNIPGDNGLDLKEQKRTEKNRQSIWEDGHPNGRRKPLRRLQVLRRPVLCRGLRCDDGLKPIA